eukprot:m.20043 g.20043  ORF g.20043 m.20043 type:complete len:135 (+) comp12717_c0_seq1:2308-2712(+)
MIVNTCLKSIEYGNVRSLTNLGITDQTHPNQDILSIMSTFSGKNFSFVRMTKNHPELAPLFVTLGIGCTLSAAYIGRLCTRPDVVWSGRNEMPWTKVTQTTNLHFTAFTKTKTAEGKPVFVSNASDSEDLRGKL